ncbi:tRNA (adenosine(37)-N6)-threonylcarbamoyltransferase complex transferase subunit TsaD [Patescibacteria group bacterium AH-259-L05]|nr:tRNA (adenosine(37)-N6)-threonylcarbamoyltransferase complex transferase subunit TsaD [Patescibacteria group bacterium AH-259-L05]
MNSKKNLTILGIETSCDETAVSLLKATPTNKGVDFEIISNVVNSQIELHKKYGGVVPEVAARAHIEKILPAITLGLPQKYTPPDIIAVTHGPGLITSLLIGVETAKTLSYTWQKPLIGINHLKAHIYANWLMSSHTLTQQSFPALCLIVSGGHTELVLMKNHYQFRKIGQTRDDAAGECFDKVAKLLGLGYPGGPIISHYAEKAPSPAISPAIDLPRPMIHSHNFDFSFSGLKTAVLYLLKDKSRGLRLRNDKGGMRDDKGEVSKKDMKKLPQSARNKKQQFIAAVCNEVQQAIIDVLIAKTIRAAQLYKVQSVILCGGVAANKQLRKQLENKINHLPYNINFFVPPIKFCTDNASMIAAAAYFKYQNLTIKQKKQLKKNWQTIKVDPNLEI